MVVTSLAGAPLVCLTVGFRVRVVVIQLLHVDLAVIVIVAFVLVGATCFLRAHVCVTLVGI